MYDNRIRLEGTLGEHRSAAVIRTTGKSQEPCRVSPCKVQPGEKEGRSNKGDDQLVIARRFKENGRSATKRKNGQQDRRKRH